MIVSQEECEFCEIAQGRQAAEVIYRSRSTLAFFPLSPATPGHTLLIPVEHFEDFFALRPEIAQELTHAALLVAKALRGALEPAGMNIITSAGQAATQSVFHLHIHLVPRWLGDRMGSIWPPPGQRVEDQTERRQLAERIKDMLPGKL
ncbi:HIT family protein [Nonomuraea sp. NPDC049725]|uniref:HIT family protein n=1 Tax=Nonomuraea sp. NPDC049725 TaxID=3154508 RepID=UPI00343E41FE